MTRAGACGRWWWSVSFTGLGCHEGGATSTIYILLSEACVRCVIQGQVDDMHVQLRDFTLVWAWEWSVKWLSDLWMGGKSVRGLIDRLVSHANSTSSHDWVLDWYKSTHELERQNYRFSRSPGSVRMRLPLSSLQIPFYVQPPAKNQATYLFTRALQASLIMFPRK